MNLIEKYKNIKHKGCLITMMIGISMVICAFYMSHGPIGFINDGIWHVNPIKAYGVMDAPADGSVAEWAQGWFIAHNYYWGGNRITSKPEKVEVYDKVYTLKGSEIVGDYVTEDMISIARSNGGIVFQTCVTEDTNLLVYYQPETENDKYPYAFVEYPYVSTDGKYIGFYN